MSFRTTAAGLVAGAVVLAGAPQALQACSICRCSDPTFNALGKDGFANQGFRAAIDSERFDKAQGDPADEVESQVENRFTLLASYGFSETLTLFARVPWSSRDLTSRPAGEPTESLHTSGLSDPEVYGQVRLWASELTGSVGRRASLSLNAGLKTPWGRNDLKRGGARLDEHVQSGTGSTDLFGGLAFLYLLNRDSSVFASASYRHTGANAEGYRYGRIAIASLAYEHKLGRLDAVVEADYRHAGRDRVDAGGGLDGNTGGSLLYLTPRLLLDLGHGLVLRASGQFPVARGLNGFQTERPVANLGLTYVMTP